MSDIRSKILWWSVDRRLKLDRPFIIAITGSIAKTSTKEAVGAVVRAKFPDRVRIGYGNLNTYLGVPLAVLGFKLDFREHSITWQWPLVLFQAVWRSLTTKLPKYLVLEFGADRPNDIKQLTTEIKPNIGIITITGPAHLENYPSEVAIAQEKGLLISSIKPGGVAILNQNDPHLKNYLVPKKVKLVKINCPLQAISETVARTVGEELKLSGDQINLALATFRRPNGRFNQFKVGSATIIDDSYNANPLSMRAALELLSRLPGRRVAILGSMLELGSKEVQMHQEIGRLAKTKADLIIGVGALAKNYQPDTWFSDSTLASREILAYLKKGDSILVKGSRGIKMEIIVQILRKNVTF